MRTHARIPWPPQGSAEVPYPALSPRQAAPDTCDRGHLFTVVFAAGIRAPEMWQCRCGSPAGQDGAGTEQTEHERRMEQLLARRTLPELEAQLAERITEIRRARPGSLAP